MQAPSIIGMAIVVMLFLAGMWDVYAFTCLSWRETVSAVLHEWARQFPILALVIGILLGHFFWPIRPDPPLPA